MIHFGFGKWLLVLKRDCIGIEHLWLWGNHIEDWGDLDWADGSGHAKKKYGWTWGLLWRKKWEDYDGCGWGVRKREDPHEGVKGLRHSQAWNLGKSTGLGTTMNKPLVTAWCRRAGTDQVTHRIKKGGALFWLIPTFTGAQHRAMFRGP